MSVEKTEALTTALENPENISVQEWDGHTEVKYTDAFKYLGATMEKSPGCKKDIANRIEAARKAFMETNVQRLGRQTAKNRSQNKNVQGVCRVSPAIWFGDVDNHIQL